MYILYLEQSILWILSFHFWLQKFIIGDSIQLLDDILLTGLFLIGFLFISFKRKLIINKSIYIILITCFICFLGIVFSGSYGVSYQDIRCLFLLPLLFPIFMNINKGSKEYMIIFLNKGVLLSCTLAVLTISLGLLGLIFKGSNLAVLYSSLDNSPDSRRIGSTFVNPNTFAYFLLLTYYLSIFWNRLCKNNPQLDIYRICRFYNQFTAISFIGIIISSSRSAFFIFFLLFLSDKSVKLFSSFSGSRKISPKKIVNSLIIVVGSITLLFLIRIILGNLIDDLLITRTANITRIFRIAGRLNIWESLLSEYNPKLIGSSISSINLVDVFDSSYLSLSIKYGLIITFLYYFQIWLNLRLIKVPENEKVFAYSHFFILMSLSFVSDIVTIPVLMITWYLHMSYIVSGIFIGHSLQKN